MTDCVFDNIAGDHTSNSMIAPLFYWSDYLDFSHTTVSNSGTALQTSPTLGAIFVDVRELGKCVDILHPQSLCSLSLAK